MECECREMMHQEKTAARGIANCALLLMIASVAIGCSNEDKKTIERLSSENLSLKRYKEGVETTDRIMFGSLMRDNSKGCLASEYYALKNRHGCATEKYAKGLVDHEKAIGKEINGEEVSRWAMVAELNNRYNQTHKDYGGARFKSVGGAVKDEDFRKNAMPERVVSLIRAYRDMSTKDFSDLLARTSGGEKTSISPPQTKKPEVSTQESNRKMEEPEKDPLAEKQKAAKETRKVETEGRKWTYDQAMKEACDAGRQYREDVDLHGMKPSQARYEAQEYSKYLSENSPAPQKALYDKINQGLWMDSCF